MTEERSPNTAETPEIDEAERRKVPKDYTTEAEPSDAEAGEDQPPADQEGDQGAS